jgi:ABC-2 type transport system permease protein
MLTIFRSSLSRSWGQILGWGLSLAALGGLMLQFYDTLAAQQEQLSKMIQAYPPAIMSFFGNMNLIFTPAGYLDTEFFSYMPIVLGIFAILIGGTILAGDEESGILDLILAHPVSRSGIFWGRLGAFLVSLILILVISWAGFAIGLTRIQMNLTIGQLALPFLSLFALMVFFFAFTLLLSMLLPSSRSALMTAGIILVAAYFVSSLARVSKELADVAKLSPMNYYQGGLAANGMNWGWFVGLLVAALVLVLIAWQLFEHRDIRVSGEGSWKLALKTG